MLLASAEVTASLDECVAFKLSRATLAQRLKGKVRMARLRLYSRDGQ